MSHLSELLSLPYSPTSPTSELFVNAACGYLSSGLNDPVLADDAGGQMDEERDSFSERDLLKVQQGAFSAVE